MKKLLAFALLFSLSWHYCFGQDELMRYSLGQTPMHKFFQQFADSTIIIEYANVPDGKPSSYKLISKTGSFVNTFNYDPLDTAYYPLYKLKKMFPVILWNMIGTERSNFKNRPADINIFFNLINLKPDTAKKIWNEISKHKPWQIVDDSVFGRGCKGIVDNFVNDGGSPAIIHLITKKEIKTLIFWSPGYYEKLCPGNKSRKAAIKIEEIIDKYYPTIKSNYY
ncbi:hypothetical protein J7E50_10255 [Pedobacter sp. ISL-68]|uniref:hypothetical protein n=1 Tax=unclassified Pedobacter TaxID=2628915 RepID=UPI001BE6CEE6|nr:MULTISPECIES: hypothetical protein [unclassified Pedobacter]MBT2561212.1 hypothetical protein [Pedobacter sp. ISL-64]MBT2590601.1 hypothetical protein [Pedobacter sp. ISL-68]